MTIATGEQALASDILAMLQSGLASAKPAASGVPDGSLYWETDTQLLKQAQSSSWVSLEFITLSSFSVSDTLKTSNDTERSTAAGSYTKVKEILLNGDIDNCRVKFTLRNDTNIVTAKVYKNGVAIGTLRSVDSTTTTFSEDFAGFSSGDLIQIYAYTNGGTTGYVSDFRLYYEYTILTINGYTLTVPLEVTVSTTNQDP